MQNSNYSTEWKMKKKKTTFVDDIYFNENLNNFTNPVKLFDIKISFAF